ncbi:cytochrome P450 [Actinomadura sp. DLS-62]|uniref:Cytochrome P450 n=1 Tax=Actinomadura monticuli TaxID=3097367 RepID=A0ABV4Q4I7_9ACTN
MKAALADPRLSRDPAFALPAWHATDRGRPIEDDADLGAHLLTREGDVHWRLRKLVFPAFTARKAQGMRSRVQEIADSLIDDFQSRGHADLIDEFAYPLATMVICEVLGVPVEHYAIFRQWTSNARPDAAAGPDPAGYLCELIAARRAAPSHDVVGVLVAAEAAGEISEAELRSMIFLLLIAGHEGSVALIANGVLALLADGVQRALLRERRCPMESAIEEIVRYDGPMELAAWRFAKEPVEVGGVVIPAGSPVVLALAAAHRDPRRFRDPDQFDITRTGNAHLGFGYGAHHCLGAPLARVEGAVALATLFSRLPDLALSTSVEELERQPSTLVRGLFELNVVFTPRTSR